MLIDLRDGEDYAKGHIPGATNLLPETIREQIAEVAQKDTPIFLYCYGGMLSYQAEALLQAGVTSMSPALVESTDTMGNWKKHK